MSRKVDVWGGVDGCAELWEGLLVSDTPDARGRYDILVTDKRFLDDIGFDEPWKADAIKLGEDHFVGYDDWAWSEPGDVKPDKEERLWPLEKYCAIQNSDSKILVISLEDRFNFMLGNRS